MEAKEKIGTVMILREGEEWSAGNVVHDLSPFNGTNDLARVIADSAKKLIAVGTASLQLSSVVLFCNYTEVCNALKLLHNAPLVKLTVDQSLSC